MPWEELLFALISGAVAVMLVAFFVAIGAIIGLYGWIGCVPL